MRLPSTHGNANLPLNNDPKEEGGGGEERQPARDSLLINVIEEGNKMLENLRILNLKPQVRAGQWISPREAP